MPVFGPRVAKYEHGTPQRRLKKRITKDESRRLR